MDAADVDDLLSRLKEAEELLQFPAVAGHAQRAEKLLLSIARASASVTVTNLSMNAITLASARSASPLNADAENLNRLLAKMRLALQELKRDAKLTSS